VHHYASDVHRKFAKKYACCVYGFSCASDRLHKRSSIDIIRNMKERYGEIAKQILLTVGIAGVVVVAVAAPGVVLTAKLFDKNQQGFSKKDQKQKTAQAMRRLQKNNLLYIKERKGKLTIELTKEGKRKFGEIQLDRLQIVKPSRWDKKWRIVVFDIPDKSFRRARDVLREKLKAWNFYPLQKSVWVCPWPCENEIQLVAELYDIAVYVNVIVAEKILDDTLARKHFGLS
jgi:DNA-binding transcriptional regulator PaaX